MGDDLIRWLVAELEIRGWSQRELGRRAGVSSTTVSQVIAGQRKPTYEFCVSVAAVLGESKGSVLTMAGLLPPPVSDGGLSPEAQADLDMVTRYVAMHSPDAQKAVTEQLVNLSKLAAELSGVDKTG